MNRLSFSEQFNILIKTDPAYRHASTATLAEATGSSLQTIANLISGKTPAPRLQTVRGICEAFNITLDYFMCDTPDACLSYLCQAWRQPADIIELDQKVQSLSQPNQEKLGDILELLIHASSAM